MDTAMVCTIESLADLERRPRQLQLARLPVATLPDSTELSLPVLVLDGAREGPTLLLTALIHGIEIGGYEVIRQLMREMIDPCELAGRVVAIPVANPTALSASSRFTPQDSADLNRVFPGSRDGTLSQRLARILVDEFVAGADYVIDFHSCNPPSVVFTIVPPGGSPEVLEASWAMAEAFGAITVAPGDHLPGTFAATVAALGKPIITPELVFSRRLEPASTSAGVRGTLNVMKNLGMLPGNPEGQPDGILPFCGRMSYATYYAAHGGFVHLGKAVGETVRAGERFGVVRNPWGELIAEMHAPVDGLVLAYPMAGNQALATGDKVAYFAFTP